MLVPAILYKSEIEKEFGKRIYDDEFIFYAGCPNNYEIPNVGKNDDQKREWAVIDNNENLLGYLSYQVWSHYDCIRAVTIYSFSKNNPIFIVDIFNHFKELVHKHHKVMFVSFEGNPIKPAYDKFCKKFNGKVIELRDEIKNNRGEFLNKYIYEILDYDWKSN